MNQIGMLIVRDEADGVRKALGHRETPEVEIKRVPRTRHEFLDVGPSGKKRLGAVLQLALHSPGRTGHVDDAEHEPPLDRDQFLAAFGVGPGDFIHRRTAPHP